jgi:hypothetical protein
MDISGVLLVLAVAGATEFLRRLQLRDYFAALTIVVAAVIGGVAGAFNVEGLPDVFTGVVAGLSASGLVRTAGAVTTRVVAPAEVK